MWGMTEADQIGEFQSRRVQTSIRSLCPQHSPPFGVVLEMLSLSITVKRPQGKNITSPLIIFNLSTLTGLSLTPSRSLHLSYWAYNSHNSPFYAVQHDHTLCMLSYNSVKPCVPFTCFCSSGQWVDCTLYFERQFEAWPAYVWASGGSWKNSQGGPFFL